MEIPVVSLDSLLDGKIPEIKLAILPYEDGSVMLDQVIAILAIAVAENPSDVLEIGTFMGHTTRQLAENLPNATINTVDLPLDFNPDKDSEGKKDDFHLIRHRQVGREFRYVILRNRIRQFYMDTATWDFNVGSKPGLFFIDGSHSYEYCKNDSEKCWSISEPGSVFLWHDYNEIHPGVMRLIHEWVSLGRNIQRINNTPIAYLKRT